MSVTAFDHADAFRDDRIDSVTEQIRELEALGYFGNDALDLGRKRTATIDRANPATARFIREVPGSSSWLDLMPTAGALDLCYNPVAESLPNGAPVTPLMSSWARNIADTMGIRSRAAAFQELAVAQARGVPTPQRWLSLACGAAHPAIDTMRRLRREGTEVARLDLVDYDSRALDLARRYAVEAGLSRQIATHRMNVLDRRGVSSIRLSHRFAQPLSPPYDLVEAIGLLEYLRVDDWPYQYGRVVRTRRLMAGARTFLANAWALVKPGGLLVFGNMLDTHPQLRFTLNVLQWPHIQPRPVSAITSLMEAAGLDGERRVLVPTDGVYAMYAVTKPR